ncbi:MAG: ParA family protein, partial [Methylocella sp.]
LVTRWQSGVRQHAQILERLEAEAKAEDAGILKTRVPQAAALAEALVRGDVPTIKEKYGKMMPILNQLVQELKGVLHV